MYEFAAYLAVGVFLAFVGYRVYKARKDRGEGSGSGGGGGGGGGKPPTHPK